MRQIEREIQAQRLKVQGHRTALGGHARSTLGCARHALQSPWTLATGFGLGLVLGLRRPRRSPTAPEPAHEPPALIQWLLRDLALPAAMGWLTQRSARATDHEDLGDAPY